jgi:hypothetical protein
MSWKTSGIDEWSRDIFGTNITSFIKTSSYTPHLAYIPHQMAITNGTSHPSLYLLALDNAWNANVTRCSLGTTYVEAQVTCISRGSSGKALCGVDEIRKMPDPSTPSDFSLLDAQVPHKCLSPSEPCYKTTTSHPRDTNVTSNLHKAFNNYIEDELEASNDLTSIRPFSPVLRYILNPLDAFTAEGSRPTDITDPNDIKMVERRLSLLYNTLWKASWVYQSVMTGNVTASLERNAKKEPLPAAGKLITTESTTKFEMEPVYVLNIPWLVMYFVSVAIMLAASIFSLVMHYRCHAPQILGFVSNLVRESKHFESVQGNSCEDGTKASKRLAAIKVKLADINGTEPGGKIAFAPAQNGMRIRKRRWYE